MFFLRAKGKPAALRTGPKLHLGPVLFSTKAGRRDLTSFVPAIRFH